MTWIVCFCSSLGLVKDNYNFSFPLTFFISHYFMNICVSVILIVRDFLTALNSPSQCSLSLLSKMYFLVSLILFEIICTLKLDWIIGPQLLPFAVYLEKETACFMCLTFSKFRKKYKNLWQYINMLTFILTYTSSASSLGDITFLSGV